VASGGLREIDRQEAELVHALRFHEAIEWLEAALRRSDLEASETTDVLFSLAEQHFGLGDLEAALPAYADALARCEARSWRAERVHRSAHRDSARDRERRWSARSSAISFASSDFARSVVAGAASPCGASPACAAW